MSACLATKEIQSPANLKLVAPASSRLTAPILSTLALLSAIAPLATDFYLPAFPRIEAGLSTSIASVQLTLSAFLVGCALGQLLFGPISDRWGRVPPLVAGMTIFVIASAATALAPNIEILVAMRFVQGVGGASGMVLGRAIISDLAQSKKEAARAFNLMMALMGIAPVVAPWIGSLLVAPLGWRGLFWVVFTLTLVMLCAVLAFIRESHPPKQSPLRIIHGTHSRVGTDPLLSRDFIGYAFAFGLSFAAFMAYISASPSVFQVIIGFSVVQYGTAFALIALLLTATSLLSAHLSVGVSTHRQLRVGLLMLLAACGTLAILVFSSVPRIWLLPPLVAAVGSFGLIQGNATSAALAAAHKRTGTGSAILGALQFGLGALAAPLVGLRGEGSAAPLAAVMCTASFCALVAFFFTKDKTVPNCNL